MIKVDLRIYSTCKCGKLSGSLVSHYCPYLYKVNNDKRFCNCCQDCMIRCTRNIE